MPCLVVFLVAIDGFAKVACALTADFGPGALFGDDSSLFTTHVANTKDLDLFSTPSLQEGFDVTTQPDLT
jgi:hypothetical protein